MIFFGGHTHIYFSMYSCSGLLLESESLSFCIGAGLFSQDWFLLLIIWMATLNNFGGLGNHIILNCEHLVVEECFVVLLDGSLGIFWSSVGNGGWSQELSEIVSVKAAYFELSNFCEKFLKESKMNKNCGNYSVNLPSNRCWSLVLRRCFSPWVVCRMVWGS